VSNDADRVDWRALWASGDLVRFCFVSLGILLHATSETMLATIIPALVRDLSGIQLVGWSFAIYQLGSIIAGAAAGRMVSYISLRANMAGAAFIYGIGALACAMAPDMPWFIAGRLIQGFGGGALIALAYVSVERLFHRNIWPQLFAIMSVVWGVCSFGGPLLGAIVSGMVGWRGTFGVFGAGGFAMAAISYMVLSGPAATSVRRSEAGVPPFPFISLACLGLAVMLIASAGIEADPWRSAGLLGAGLGGLVLFFVVDAARPRSRLFPSKPFSWRSPVGVGLTMIATFCVATISFSIYAPLLLSSMHDISILATGYIIASESIAWSVLAILTATARPQHEKLLIILGALMISGGVVGFGFAIPSGSVPLILFCALLQGGGFGIAWPFVSRMIVSSAAPADSTVASSAVPAMQRLGYAVGAATAGIIANSFGFAEGFNRDTAAAVAPWLFFAFSPLCVVGCVAAFTLTGNRLRGSRDAAAVNLAPESPS